MLIGKFIDCFAGWQAGLFLGGLVGLSGRLIGLVPVQLCGGGLLASADRVFNGSLIRFSASLFDWLLQLFQLFRATNILKGVARMSAIYLSTFIMRASKMSHHLGVLKPSEIPFSCLLLSLPSHAVSQDQLFLHSPDSTRRQTNEQVLLRASGNRSQWKCFFQSRVYQPQQGTTPTDTSSLQSNRQEAK